MRIGKSAEEKRRIWNEKVRKIEALAEWQPIFLWFPTELFGETRWLETVYRKRVHLKTEVKDGRPAMAINGYWEYKLAEERA